MKVSQKENLIENCIITLCHLWAFSLDLCSQESTILMCKLSYRALVWVLPSYHSMRNFALNIKFEVHVTTSLTGSLAIRGTLSCVYKRCGRGNSWETSYYLYQGAINMKCACPIWSPTFSVSFPTSSENKYFSHYLISRLQCFFSEDFHGCHIERKMKIPIQFASPAFSQCLFHKVLMNYIFKN